MRYWAYLAGKLVVAASPLYGLLILLGRKFTAPPKGWPRLHNMNQELVGALCMLGWFLVCAGALYLIVWDQRRRCRVCLRHLRMPIETDGGFDYTAADCMGWMKEASFRDTVVGAQGRLIFSTRPIRPRATSGFPGPVWPGNPKTARPM